MISVELLLDERTESAILAEWSALIDAGLPSAGRHPGESNRPHITLAVRDAPRSLALSVPGLPLEVRLGGFVLFPGRAGRVVLARQVVLDSALLAVHHAVTETVGPVDDERYETTAPGGWTPHITLARRMPLDRVPEALAALSSSSVKARAVALRIWDAETKAVTMVG